MYKNVSKFIRVTVLIIFISFVFCYNISANDNETAESLMEQIDSLVKEIDDPKLDNFQKIWNNNILNERKKIHIKSGMSENEAYIQTLKERLNYLNYFSENSIHVLTTPKSKENNNNNNNYNYNYQNYRPSSEYSPRPQIPDYRSSEDAKMKWIRYNQYIEYYYINMSDNPVMILGYEINRGNTQSLEKLLNVNYSFTPITAKFGQSIKLFTIPFQESVMEAKIFTNKGYQIFSFD